MMSGETDSSVDELSERRALRERRGGRAWEEEAFSRARLSGTVVPKEGRGAAGKLVQVQLSRRVVEDAAELAQAWRVGGVPLGWRDVLTLAVRLGLATVEASSVEIA